MNLRGFLTVGAIVGPYPNTIIPGTLADANQVQGNFDWVRDQVNANVAGGGGNNFGLNLLYNSAMLISQRFVATSKNVAATQAYTLDRWQVKSGAGGSADVQQQSSIGNAGFQNSIRVQRTAANTAVTLIQLAQSLETADSYPMQGQALAFSFYARCGGTYSPASTALAFAVNSGTGSNENVLSGYTGSVTEISGTATLSTSWQRFTGVTSTTAAAALTEIGVVFSMTPVGTAGASDWFEITGVQLEIAPAASAFRPVQFGNELARCQRYYQKSFVYGTVPAGSVGAGAIVYISAFAGATGNFAPAVVFPTRMRTTPTATLYNPAANNAQVRNLTRSQDCSASATPFLTDASMVVSCTGSAGTAVADEMEYQYTLEAEL